MAKYSEELKAKGYADRNLDAKSYGTDPALSKYIENTAANLTAAAQMAKKAGYAGVVTTKVPEGSAKSPLADAIRLVADTLNQKSSERPTAIDMQKKKEDRLEAKTPIDSLQIKKDRAEKALADFDENDEVDATSAHDRKRHDEQRKRLQQEAEQANAEFAAREESRIQEQDNADIEAMSEEERQSLEQYAVNRVRDQNLPLEMQGMMPTAEQEVGGLIGKYGKQRADELAETFMRQENAGLAKQADEAGRKFANEKPFWASAATVPINLMAGITGAVGQLQGAARATGRYRSLDANETGTALDKFSGAIREQTAQNIEGDVYDENGELVKDGGTLRKLGSLAYQGGMSFLDSTARMLASGGSSGVSSAIAATGAFSQGLQKYSAMGASPEQAALAATASAGLEYITEKLPTEQVLKIFNKGGSTNAVKEVLKQAFLVEPLGEEVNLFAGIAAEAVILGDKSGKQQMIGDLIAGGLTKEDAEKAFWKQTFLEAAETYAVSAVAGGLGAGGAAYAGNQVQTAQDQRQEMAAEPVTPAAPAPNETQLAVEDAAAALQKKTEAPAPAAPMTEKQEQLQQAIAEVTGMEGRQELAQSKAGQNAEADLKLAEMRQLDADRAANKQRQQQVYEELKSAKSRQNDLQKQIERAEKKLRETGKGSQARIDQLKTELEQQNSLVNQLESQNTYFTGDYERTLEEAVVRQEAVFEDARNEARKAIADHAAGLITDSQLQAAQDKYNTAGQEVYRLKHMTQEQYRAELAEVGLIGDHEPLTSNAPHPTPNRESRRRVAEAIARSWEQINRGADLRTPTTEELSRKKDTAVVKIGRNAEGKNYDQLKADIVEKAKQENWYDAPYFNDDTGMPVFITRKTLTHSYSNLKADFGTETLLALQHMPEIIESAVLVNVAPPRNTRKPETRVLTFFAAAEGDNGTIPIKLTVKEYNSQSGNPMPQDIRKFFETAKLSGNFDSLYDLEAIEVINSDGTKKEFDASAIVANGSGEPSANSTPNSTIKVADLLGLVKGKAEKYIPGRENAAADNLNASASNLDSSNLKIDASSDSAQAEDSKTMPAEGGQINGTVAAEANFTGKAAYANLLQEGNVQPDRPGDVRPMEVPKTDGNGKRVTEFAANAYGAGGTTDEMASVIESLIQDGDLGFDVRTNRESLNNAAAVINKKGAAEARNQITRSISKGKIRDGDIEQGILLYSRYAEKGDNDNASEMLVDLAQMANITGRNLQLFKLLRRMTVEGQVMTLEKEVRRSVESMVSSGQVKKGYEPSFDPQMMDGYRKALEELRNAKTPEAQEAAKQKAKQAQEAVYADAAAKMPATFKAKWDAWRYMAMLGNAKTQIRNIAGNAAFVPYKEVKDKMGALAEKVLVPKDQRTKSLTMDRGLIQWAREDRKTNESVQDALKYSAAIGDDVTSQKIRDEMKVFNTKALENLRGFVNKVPQAGDMLFKSGYYERSLAGFLRGRGYNAADIRNGKVSETVLNEARSYAVQEAMKATFNDCNAFSDFLATELRYQGDNPVGKALNIAAEGVLPFRRTPANIAVRFTEYSPVGVAKGLWNAATKVRSGEMTAATAIDQLTAGLTGSSVMALGYALAEGLSGIKITGSGTDEDEKRQGHQDYALEFSVDGQEYSYKIDWAAPANLPLFVGANIYNALNGAGKAQDVSAFTSFLRGMGTMFEPLLALSCMSSLNDLVEGVRYADEGEALYSMAASMATSYFTQGIPALARQHYQSKQEYKQTTFTTSDDPTIQDLQKTAAGLGVSDAYKTDKVDAWGQKESQGTPLERGINAFLNPGTLKKIDNSAVEKEITRLNEAGYNVSPNTASRTVSYIDKDGYGHDDVRLTEEQFQKLAQTQGQTSRELLEDMFASKDYAAMTDAQKAEALDTAYLYARKTGEIAAIDGHTGYDQTWMMDVKKKGANEILRRVLNSELNGSMSDLDEAWDKGYHEENFDRALQTAYDSYSKATPAMKKQVYNEAEGTTKKYLEARSKGISHIDFVAVAENIAKVKGTGSINKDTGKATVRDIDRRKAIANTSGMTDKEIDIVMKAYMADYDPKAESPETTEFKYQYAREKLGLTPKQYVSTYQAYLDGDKKKDKIAAIRELGYDYSTANALYKLYYGRMKNELIDLYG